MRPTPRRNGARRPRRAPLRALGLALAVAAPGVSGEEAPLAARGETVFRAALCAACHTDADNDGAFLAGGRAFETPFGTFYSPNITPDRRHGIGAWSEEQLDAALRHGVGPGGEHYYPVFPYPAYTRMRRDDVRALGAYLATVEPHARPDRAHELPWYMRYRIVNWAWKYLFFEPGELAPDPGRSAQWNRGAYLVRALGHCGECHTPRNVFGALDESMHLAGAEDGPEGDAVPNITPDEETGIGRWSRDEIVEYLSRGMTPDFDFAGGLMAEVIDEGLAHLERADLEAIAEYLKSVPPIRNEIGGE